MNSMSKSILMGSASFIPFCFKSYQQNSCDTDRKSLTVTRGLFISTAACSSRDLGKGDKFQSDLPLIIKNYTFQTAVTSGSYIEMISCTVKGALTSDSFIKLTNSTVGSVKSNSYVKTIDSTTSGIRADSFVQASNSQVNGHITSGSYVSLQDAEVGNVKATGTLIIKNSKILGDAETSTRIDSCEDSMITGAIKCHNLNLEISRSQVKEIIAKHSLFSNSTSTTLISKIKGLFVKSYISSDSTTLALKLKELRDSGQIELQPNRIIVGKKTAGASRSISQLSSLTIESYSNSGSNVSISTTTSFWALNSTAGSSLELQVGDFHLSAKDVQEISEAIQLVLNNSPLCTSEQRTNLKAQVVTLRDSHVECITFEKPGGIVKLLGSSSVQKVNGGTIENTN